MKTNVREILIFYNPESSLHKKTVAHAKSLSRYVTAFPFKKSASTEMYWRMMINKMGRRPKELMNKAHPYYQEHIRGREFDEEGWLKILRNNPDILKAPVAVRGKEVLLCENPTDIYRLIPK